MFLTYQFKPCWTIKKCVFFSLFCGTKEAAILSSMGGARRVSREFYSLLINVWQVTLANGNSRTDLQVNIDDDCINTAITTIFFIQNNNYFLQVQRRHFKENSHLCREILQLLMDRVSAQNNSIFY